MLHKLRFRLIDPYPLKGIQIYQGDRNIELVFRVEDEFGMDVNDLTVKLFAVRPDGKVYEAICSNTGSEFKVKIPVDATNVNGELGLEFVAYNNNGEENTLYSVEKPVYPSLRVPTPPDNYDGMVNFSILPEANNGDFLRFVDNEWQASALEISGDGGAVIPSDPMDMTDFYKKIEADSKFATKEDIPVIPDHSQYALKSEIPAPVDTSQFALISEVPTVEELAALEESEEIAKAIADLGMTQYAKLVDLAPYAMTSDLVDFAKITDIPDPQDLSAFALKSEIPVIPDHTQYALKTEIPDISHLATKAELTAVQTGGEVDLTNYYTKLETDNKYATKLEIPEPQDLTPYALKTDIPVIPDHTQYALKTEIPDITNLATKDEIPVVPEPQDLTPYALKTELPDPVDLTPYALKTELPVVPDLTPYAKKTDIPEPQDLTPYALRTEIPDHTQYALKSDVPTAEELAELEESGEIAAAIANLSMEQYVKATTLAEYVKATTLTEYAKKTELPKLPDLTPYALKTQLPDLTPYALKTDIPSPVDLTPYAKTTDLTSLATKESLTNYALKSEIPAETDLTPYQTTVQADSKYAMKEDIPVIPDHSQYALKSEIPVIPDHSQYALKTDIPVIPDHSQYALKSEIPVIPDHSQYALKSELPAPVDVSAFLTKADTMPYYYIKTEGVVSPWKKLHEMTPRKFGDAVNESDGIYRLVYKTTGFGHYYSADGVTATKMMMPGTFVWKDTNYPVSEIEKETVQQYGYSYKVWNNLNFEGEPTHTFIDASASPVENPSEIVIWSGGMNTGMLIKSSSLYVVTRGSSNFSIRPITTGSTSTITF